MKRRTVHIPFGGIITRIFLEPEWNGNKQIFLPMPEALRFECGHDVPIYL